nr:hypothetical protein CFP56_43940 [Quercus suber]
MEIIEDQDQVAFDIVPGSLDVAFKSEDVKHMRVHGVSTTNDGVPPPKSLLRWQVVRWIIMLGSNFRVEQAAGPRRVQNDRWESLPG